MLSFSSLLVALTAFGLSQCFDVATASFFSADFHSLVLTDGLKLRQIEIFRHFLRFLGGVIRLTETHLKLSLIHPNSLHSPNLDQAERFGSFSAL